MNFFIIFMPFRLYINRHLSANAGQNHRRRSIDSSSSLNSLYLDQDFHLEPKRQCRVIAAGNPPDRGLRYSGPFFFSLSILDDRTYPSMAPFNYLICGYDKLGTSVLYLSAHSFCQPICSLVSGHIIVSGNSAEADVVYRP